MEDTTPRRRLHCRLAALTLEHNARVADGQIPGPPLSQRVIADRTGLSLGAVNRLAQGQPVRIASETVERICDLLGCDVGDLLVLREVEQNSDA